jgi:hypothetical protein
LFCLLRVLYVSESPSLNSRSCDLWSVFDPAADMNIERSDEDDKGYEADVTSPEANVSIDPEKIADIEGRDQTPEVETKPVDVPPDGGYGWVCVTCLFLMNAHTWGVNSVSFFLDALPGWYRTDT